MNERHHKMYQYEVTPPATCWEKIEADLNASDMAYHYPTRMREYGITPPANAWENIASSLSKEKSGTPIRRITPFFKNAAAAAVIGLLAWGGISLLNSTNDADTGLATDTPKTETNIVKTNPGVADQQQVNDVPVDQPASLDAVADARDEAALEASKKTYASIDVPATRSKIRNVSSFFFLPDAVSSSGTRGVDPPEPDETEDPSESDADRYYTLMTPEGNIIRMSKKWGDLVCCVSGEDTDDECVEQMKKWRQQLASPNHGHSAGSFMDILGLLKSLQGDEL